MFETGVRNLQYVYFAIKAFSDAAERFEDSLPQQPPRPMN